MTAIAVAFAWGALLALFAGAFAAGRRAAGTGSVRTARAVFVVSVVALGLCTVLAIPIIKLFQPPGCDDGAECGPEALFAYGVLWLALVTFAVGAGVSSDRRGRALRRWDPNSHASSAAVDQRPWRIVLEDLSRPAETAERSDADGG